MTIDKKNNNIYNKDKSKPSQDYVDRGSFKIKTITSNNGVKRLLDILLLSVLMLALTSSVLY